MRTHSFFFLLFFTAASSLLAEAPSGPQGQSPTAAISPATQAAWDEADRQYRASYFYSLGMASELRGQAAEALALLKRASEADPSSVYLLGQLAERLEQAGQIPGARDALGAALKLEPSNVDLRQKLARLSVQAGDSEAARKLFLGPHGEDPKDLPSLKALAALDMSDSHWDAAAKRLTSIIATFPDSLDEKEMLAQVFQKQGKKAEAAAAYQALLAADPARVEAAYQLSHLQEDLGQDGQAVLTLQHAVKASPDSVVLQDALARCYYRQKKYDEAEEAFSKLVDGNPEDSDSLLYRGMTRLQNKKYQEAQADFEALGKLGQGNPSQLYGLGMAQLLQGQAGVAEKTFKRLLAEYPKAVPGYTELAAIYDKTSRTAEAVSLLETGVALNPDASDLYLLLGAADMDAGKPDKAESIFLAGLKATDDDSELRFQLAVLYDKQNQFPKSEEQFVKLLDKEPKNAQALNYLGYSYVDRGIKMDQAEALIRRALAVEPDNLYYQDSLGWAYYKQGRFEEAKKLLSKAVQVANPGPEEAVVFEHLGHTYEKLGDMKQAQINFEKAAQLKPTTGAPSPGKPDAH